MDRDRNGKKEWNPKWKKKTEINAKEIIKSVNRIGKLNRAEVQRYGTETQITLYGRFI